MILLRPLPTSPRLRRAVLTVAATLALAAPLVPATAGTLPAWADAAPTTPATTQATTPDGATLAIDSVVPVADGITVTGTGWVTQNHARGSRVVFKYDRGGVKLHTPPDVPTETDNPFTATNVVGYVDAKNDGSFTATLPFPTPANSSVADGAWAEGTTHHVTALSGSLIPGDQIRSANVTFTIGQPTCTADEVSLVHRDDQTGQVATACVTRAVDLAGGARTLHVRGFGWTTTSGQGPASVVIKLASRTDPAASDFQFVHTGATGDAILAHPTTGAPDPTMWALITPDARGSFDQAIPLPSQANVPRQVTPASAGALGAGKKLTVHFQTGLISGDTAHSITSEPLVIDGVPYAGDQTGETTACTPSGPRSVHFEYPAGQAEDPRTGPRVGFGESVILVGQGFCATKPELGGSRIAVKPDDGRFSRRPGEEVHSNATIWQIIDVISADGSFRVPITLPKKGDVAGGSSPAFTEGAHTLRLLTGSIKEGDVAGSIKTTPFTVGTYAPSGEARIIDASTELTSANANAMTATRDGNHVTATLPQAQPGTWVYLTAYAGADWRGALPTTWYQVDANHQVKATISQPDQVAAGEWTLVAQGDDTQQSVIGWARVPAADTTSSTGGGTTGGNTATPHPAHASTRKASATPVTLSRPATTIVLAPRPVAQAAKSASSSAARYPAKPGTVPASPVASQSALTSANQGGLTVTRAGSILTVTFPTTRAVGSWVYAYAFDPASPIDWLQLDDHRQVSIDVAGLHAGKHALAFIDATGALIGWVDATNTAATSASAQSQPAAAVATRHSVTQSLTFWLLLASGILLAGGIVAAVLLTRTGQARTTQGKTR